MMPHEGLGISLADFTALVLRSRWERRVGSLPVTTISVHAGASSLDRSRWGFRPGFDTVRLRPPRFLAPRGEDAGR